MSFGETENVDTFFPVLYIYFFLVGIITYINKHNLMGPDILILLLFMIKCMI